MKNQSQFSLYSCIIKLSHERCRRMATGGDGMRWAQVSVVTTHEGADLIGNILMELGAAGTEIDDPSLVNTYIDAGLWDYTDLPRAEDTETVTVRAYLPEDERLESSLLTLAERIEGRSLTVSLPMRIGQRRGRRISTQRKLGGASLYARHGRNIRRRGMRSSLISTPGRRSERGHMRRQRCVCVGLSTLSAPGCASMTWAAARAFSRLRRRNSVQAR